MHQNNGNNYEAADDGYYADADDGDDYNRRRLADDDYYNANNGDDGDDAYNANNGDDQANACEYYDVCENYRTACKDYAQQADDMQDFFECGEFNVGNNVAYMGPHCRSDGKTIGIGIYKDEYCNEYNAALSDISSYTGMDLSDGYLKPYYSDNCISCLASVSKQSIIIPF